MYRRTLLGAVCAGFGGVSGGCATLRRNSCTPEPVELSSGAWPQVNHDARNTAGSDSRTEPIRNLEVEWSVSARLANVGNVVSDGQSTYVVEHANDGDLLVARSIDTGQKRWTAGTELLPETVTPETGQVEIGTPVVTERLLFVPVSVVSRPNGPATAAGLAAVDPRNGAVAWSSETWEVLDLRVDRTGRLYLVERSPEGPGEESDGSVERRVRAIDAHAGTTCWTYGGSEGILDSITGGSTFDEDVMIRLPAVDSDFYYLPTERRDETRTQVSLLEKPSGNRRDGYTLPRSVQVGATVANGLLYATVSDAPAAADLSGPAITAYDSRTGEFQWATPLAHEISTFSVTSKALCYSDDEEGVVAALDPNTGASTWRTPNRLATTPPILGNYVVTQSASTGNVRVQALADGAVKSSVELGPTTDTIDYVAATRSHLLVSAGNRRFGGPGVLSAIRIS